MELPVVDISQYTYVEWLIFGAFASSLLFSGFFLFLTFSKKIRYSIPSSLNCWFCNENSNIPYALKNNWSCPKCHQYNGFAEDGGYNKRIPAQYIESLNRPIRGVVSKAEKVSGGSNSKTNGLCSPCNLNQELKCFQLASFVPSKDNNFDREIENEQKRLEEVYDLCASCKLIVKRKLNPTPIETTCRRRTSESMVKESAKAQVANQSSLGVLLQWAKTNTARSDGDNSKVHQGNLDQFSDTETEDEEENNTKMEKLQIGSPVKPANIWHQPTDESFRICDLNFGNNINPELPYPTPPSPPLSITPPPCKSQFRNFSCHNDSLPPSWTRYPMVHSSVGVPTCYSYCGSNGNSYPDGRLSPAPFSPISSYNYRSSSIATVFGGRKPLISPPRLSSRSPHHQPCFTSYGGYGMFYGYGTADMMIFQQFGNPMSRSSSQSSGFVSQCGMSSTPTHSRFSSAPNSVCNESLHPSVYMEQIRRTSPVEQTYEGHSVCRNTYPNPRMTGPCVGFSGPKASNSNKKGDICSRLGPSRPGEEKLGVLNEIQLYSDDEEDDSTMGESFLTALDSVPIKTSRVCHNRSRRERAKERCSKVALEDSIVYSSDDEKHFEENSVKKILIPLSSVPKYLRIFYQLFLRLALFAFTLFLFCLFFVGKWPDFLEPYLSVATECCESFRDHLEKTFPSLDLPIHCRVVGYFYPTDQTLELDSDVIQDYSS